MTAVAEQQKEQRRLQDKSATDALEERQNAGARDRVCVQVPHALALDVAHVFPVLLKYRRKDRFWD